MNAMIDVFERAAIIAGRAIMDVRRAGARASYKSDLSPVTEADEKAEAIILEELTRHYPDIPVIAEESVAAGRLPSVDGGAFFLVDPLDGTKEFISGNEDFTVNIALIEHGVPTIGIVYAPARGVAYAGGSGTASRIVIENETTVVSREVIRCREMAVPPVAVASRSHNSPETTAFLHGAGVQDTTSVGSSLKFCLLAEGTADLYPRFGRTMEWDTAAGDAVLRAAGGSTVDTNGSPLRYGKTLESGQADLANPDFIASGALETAPPKLPS